MATFLYPPAVYIASLNREREGYVVRLEGSTDKTERERLTKRLAAVDEALEIHRGRQQAELDALAAQAAEAAAQASGAAAGA